MTEQKARIVLSVFCASLTVLLAVVVWIMLDASSKLDLTTDKPAYVDDVFTVNFLSFGNADNYFRFPVIGGMLVMEKSQQYVHERIRTFTVQLLMSLIISILLR